MSTVRDNPKQPPAERMKWAQDLCGLDADECRYLAALQREAGQLDEAEASYRRFWEGASDRVAASNNVEWFVDRLRTTNRLAEAFRVAEGAAEVYSGGGLTTLAQLQEKTGRYRAAHETWTKYAERYRESNDLHQFLFRQVKAGRTEFKEEADRLEHEIFPDGRVRYVRPAGAPVQGLLLSALKLDAADQGFKGGDLIVAIEGFAVTTRPQWRVLLMEAPKDTVAVVLFRHGSFLEISPRFKTRRLGATLTAYPVRPSS